MLRSVHPVSPRRRLAGLLAAALYLVSVGILPVLHGQAEDLAGAATVEETHSTQCDRIHSDISCPAASLSRTLPAPPVLLSDPPGTVRPLAATRIPQDRRPAPEALASHYVRGPPAA